MGIALTTILVFIFLLPGLVFRRFYYTEEFSKEYFKTTPFEIFISCITPAIIFHSFWGLFALWSGTPVNISIIGELFTAKDFPREAFLNIERNIGLIILYNCTIILFAILCGYFMKKLVRKSKLDRKWKLFRFKNTWHYHFSGEFFEFPRSAFDLEQDNIEEIELVYVDALVETKEGSIIYDGVLVDYELSKDGGLENIILKDCERRFLKNDVMAAPDVDEGAANTYYKIPGHILILPFSKIININISYYKLNITAAGVDSVILVK